MLNEQKIMVSSTAWMLCTGVYPDWNQKFLAVIEVHLAVVLQALELAVGFLGQDRTRYMTRSPGFHHVGIMDAWTRDSCQLLCAVHKRLQLGWRDSAWEFIN